MNIKNFKKFAKKPCNFQYILLIKIHIEFYQSLSYNITKATAKAVNKEIIKEDIYYGICN